MAIVSRSKRLVAPAALLLLLVMAVAAAAKTTLHEATTDQKQEDESWTDWAKEKISEGLGFKHHDEEEAARKAGQTVKSASESAQNAASEVGKKASDAKDTAGNAASGASSKVGQAKDKASETVKGEAASKAGYATLKAKEAAESASEQGAEARERSKQGKAKVEETAKEKAGQGYEYKLAPYSNLIEKKQNVERGHQLLNRVIDSDKKRCFKGRGSRGVVVQPQSGGHRQGEHGEARGDQARPVPAHRVQSPRLAAAHSVCK